MDVLKAPSKAILDCPASDKAVLILVNDFQDDKLQSLSKQFG
jgi:hypothetical protein